VNEAKMMVKWREVLRSAKTTTLTNQLQELKLRVSEGTRGQESLIRVLASQVKQAHHQRSTAAHNHLSAVHKLTALHEEHVSMLTRHVRNMEAKAAHKAAMETEDQAAQHLANLRQLNLVVGAAERDHELTEKEELTAFHTTITQVTSQLEDELAVARSEKEAMLEEAWVRLSTAYRDHQNNTSGL
ncbi:unnamed protein product, partial [Meganyctiphanes norvegica]